MKNQYTLIILVFIASTINIHAQETPRLKPEAIYVSYANQKSDLTEEQFIDSSLLASGSADISYDKIRILNMINEISSSVTAIDNDYEKGESLLKILHDTLFRKYIEDQTRIDVLLDSGSYNCVSSAVLFMATARASGLTVQAVRTPDHAFASVLIADKIIDVETTNQWGYDPGQKKEFTDSFSGSTGYNYVPPGNYSMRSDISNKELIGLILQNRIAELQRRGDHSTAVPLAVDRFALTLSDEAKKDMYDTFSNYSSQLNGTGQYEKGISFLKEAIGLWGTSVSVTKAFDALVHNQLLSMIEEDNAEEAELFLTELDELEIMTDNAVQVDLQMIYDKKAVDLINSDSGFEIIQNFLNETLQQGFLKKNKWVSYTLYNYTKEAEILALSEGWLKAYIFVKEAPQDIRNQRKYIQLLNSCKGNYVITVHNLFADLYNSNKFAEAEQVIVEGLRHVPGDNTLAADLRMITNRDS